MKTIKFLAYLLLGVISCYLCSCSKINDVNKFAPNGEIKYTGRVDSTIVYSGKGRIKLTMMLGNDLSRKKIKVYWNNRADSAEMNLQQTSKKDTVSMIINNLAEGQYNFNIYTYDDQGNSSVMSYANGTVYGSEYFATLANRTLKTLELSNDGQNAILNWPLASTGEFGIEIKYTANDGIAHKVIVPNNELTTVLSNYKPGSLLSYKSLFIPVPTAIDTFSLDYLIVTLPLFEIRLDKTLFKEKILPSDIGSGFGWLMPRLWNDQISNADPNSFATSGGSGVNRWFTFDLGVTKTLSRYKVWQTQDRIYTDQNALTWEIWGSDNPAADGSFTNWTKLMNCQSIKPSGLALGSKSAEDIEFAKAGQGFALSTGLPPVRYIRIKVLTNYKDPSFMTFGEISFWTHDK